VYFRRLPAFLAGSGARSKRGKQVGNYSAWNLGDEYSTTRARSLFIARRRIVATPIPGILDDYDDHVASIRNIDPADHLEGKEGLIGRRHAIAGRVVIGFR